MYYTDVIYIIITLSQLSAISVISFAIRNITNANNTSHAPPLCLSLLPSKQDRKRFLGLDRQNDQHILREIEKFKNAKR